MNVSIENYLLLNNEKFFEGELVEIYTKDNKQLTCLLWGIDHETRNIGYIPIEKVNNYYIKDIEQLEIRNIKNIKKPSK